MCIHKLMLSCSDLQIQYGGGGHLKDSFFKSLALSAVWFMVCGVFGVRKSFLMLWCCFGLQDVHHLQSICRFDLFHIIIRASLILTRISIKLIDNRNDNNDNNNNNDNTSSSCTAATITTIKIWNYKIPNFNGCTMESWEWISNFIPRVMKDVISYHCRD